MFAHLMKLFDNTTRAQKKKRKKTITKPSKPTKLRITQKVKQIFVSLLPSREKIRINIGTRPDARSKTYLDAFERVFQNERRTVSRAAHGRVSHFFSPLLCGRGHPHTNRVSSIERRRVHLSACKCVHRWSITGRDAADCRMFIGHRISCYSAYYYGTMDRVAWRREEKKKRKEKRGEEKRTIANIFLVF